MRPGGVTVTHPTLSCPHPGTGLGDTLLHVPPPPRWSRWPWGSCVSSPVFSKEGRTRLTRWHHCSVRMKAGGSTGMGRWHRALQPHHPHAGPGQHWTPAGTCVSTTRGPAHSHVRGDTHLPWVSMRRGQATPYAGREPYTTEYYCERGHPKSQTGTSAPRCWVTCPGAPATRSHG